MSRAIPLLLLLALARPAAGQERSFVREAEALRVAHDYDAMLATCDEWVEAVADSVHLLPMALAYRYIAHRALGSLGAAEGDARRTLELMREQKGEDDVESITARNNLAGVLLLRGDLLEAEAEYRRSLALQQRRSDVSDAALARSYNNLAVVLRRQGAWADAAEMYRSAFELASRAYGSEHGTTVVARRNLARVLLAQGEFDAARVELEAVLATYGEEEGLRIARTLMLIAECDLGSGRLADAEDGVLRARRLRVEALHEGATEVAVCDWMLGRIATAGGNSRRALELGQLALRTNSARLGSLHRDVLRAKHLVASSQLELGEAEACIATLEPAIEDYELILRSSAAGLERATVDLPSPYPLLARAYLATGRVRDAWRAAELSQGKILGEVMDLQLGKLSDAQLTRRSRLSEGLENLRSEMEQAQGDELEALRGQLLEREAEWAQFEREIAAEQGFALTDVPTVESVASLLGPDDLLIGWIDGQVWSLDAAAELRWSACRQDVSARELRDRLLMARSAPAFAPPTEDVVLRDLEGALAAAWFEPLWPRLAGKRRLWVIPHGSLAGLPLAMLRDAEGRAFVDRFELVLLPSASVWHRAARAARDRGGEALFFGALSESAPTHPRFARLPELEAASAELRRCAVLQPQAAILQGSEAAEATLREWNRDGRLGRLDVLHFATHAISDPDHPGRSALMAAASAPGEFGAASSDGAITAVEIADTWRLDARLVVLSACETALGRNVRGEGYIGIGHGFFQAGAHALLLSQWEVDDEATSVLMEEFYRAWRREGASLSTALTRAQRAVRERYEHPYFWAAFTLVGAAD